MIWKPWLLTGNGRSGARGAECCRDYRRWIENRPVGLAMQKSDSLLQRHFGHVLMAENGQVKVKEVKGKGKFFPDV